MDKSMRKANKKLAEVKKYVAMTKPKQVQSVSVPQTEAPLAVVTKSVGGKVDEAEIKKIKKGDFRVIVKRNGKKTEMQKRFKSVTKAQEYIINHFIICGNVK